MTIVWGKAGTARSEAGGWEAPGLFPHPSNVSVAVAGQKQEPRSAPDSAGTVSRSPNVSAVTTIRGYATYSTRSPPPPPAAHASLLPGDPFYLETRQSTSSCCAGSCPLAVCPPVPHTPLQLEISHLLRAPRHASTPLICNRPAHIAHMYRIRP